MSSAPFFVACNYQYAEYSVQYMQFNAHDCGFIMLFLPTPVEKINMVALTRLITLCGSGSVMGFLVIEWSSKAHLN